MKWLMTDTHSDELTRLLERISVTLGDDLPAWPGGWPTDVEAALLDTVFSIRARYGSPTTGVRAVVHRWMDYRGGRADDLSVLGATDPAVVRKILSNNAKSSSRYKADIVVDAAARFAAVGLVHAADFTGDADQRAAYLGVKGCGRVTWPYFGMLLGTPNSKPDTWIMRYVRAVVGDQTSTDQARELINQAAAALGVNASRLDHAIWSYARRH